MNVWIVGSAKIHELPDASPDIVYYANGAVWHREKIPVGSSSQRVVTIAPVLLPQSELESASIFNDRELFESGVVHRLIFDNGPYEQTFVRETLDFPAEVVIDRDISKQLSGKVVPLTYRDIYKLMLLGLGKRITLKILCSILFKRPVRFLLGFLRNRPYIKTALNSQELKVSTGVLALLVALSQSREDDNFFLLGVSDDGTQYAYDSAVSIRSNHIKADLLVLSNLINKRFWRITIMDKLLEKKIQF